MPTESTTSKLIIQLLMIDEEKHIALRFLESEISLWDIKKINGIRYHEGLSLWYLPHTAQSMMALRRVDAHLIIDRKTVHRCSTRQSHEKSANTAIGKDSSTTDTAQTKEGGKFVTDVLYHGVLESIVWQGGKLIIRMQYDESLVAWVKGLVKSYWHRGERCWIARGCRYNLEKVQAKLSYWDHRSYERLLEMAEPYSQKPRVRITACQQNAEMIEVYAPGYEKIIKFMKSIPRREYLKQKRRWRIPRDRGLVQELRELVEGMDLQWTDRVAWETEEHISRSQDGSRKFAALMKGVPRQHREAVSAYLQSFLSQQRSWSTMRSYVGAYLRALHHTGGVDVLKSWTRKEISAYLSEIAMQEVSESELNRHISALKWYYKHVEGWSEVRLEVVRRPKKPNRLPKILSQGQVLRMLQSLKNRKHLSMMMLSYGCGLRPSEVVSLRHDDLHLERGQIHVPRSKHKKERVVNMPECVVPVLNAYIMEQRPDYWLFPGQEASKHYSQSSLRKIFDRARSYASVPKKFTLYSMRHSFATHLMESGTQLRFIQKLLGHRSSKTTEIYTHVSKASLEDVRSPLDGMLGREMGKNGK